MGTQTTTGTLNKPIPVAFAAPAMGSRANTA